MDSRPLRTFFGGTLRLRFMERSTPYGECEKAREEGQIERESCEVASWKQAYDIYDGCDRKPCLLAT